MKRRLFPLLFILVAAPDVSADGYSQETLEAVWSCMKTQSNFRTISGSFSRRPVHRTNDAAKDGSRVLVQSIVWLEDRGNSRRLLDALCKTNDGRSYAEKICFDGETSWYAIGSDDKTPKRVAFPRDRALPLDEIETHAWAIGLRIDRAGRTLSHFIETGGRDLGGRKIREADCQGVAFTGRDREREITGEAWLDCSAGGLPRRLEVRIDGTLSFRCDIHRFVELIDEASGRRISFPAEFVCHRPPSEVHFESAAHEMRINRDIFRTEFQSDQRPPGVEFSAKLENAAVPTPQSRKGTAAFAKGANSDPAGPFGVAPAPQPSSLPIVGVFVVAGLAFLAICVGLAKNPRQP